MESADHIIYPAEDRRFRYAPDAYRGWKQLVPIYYGRTANQPEYWSGFSQPYAALSRIKRNCCNQKKYEAYFSNSEIDEPKGFHITRRTFASNMLRSGSSVSLIASALGHAGIQNVEPYLSTDNTSLGLCAISCKSIEYKGRYGLWAWMNLTAPWHRLFGS